jgi:predicted SAM-dependent methyltransferase
MVNVLSVHVPKTAGSTFKKLLIQVYSPSCVYLDYQDFSHSANLNSIPSDTKVIHGHFPIQKYSDHFSDANKITWLRHPISRLISHYFYGRSLPQDEVPFDMSTLGIIDFAELPWMQNHMTLHLEGVNLADFCFVGIQEFFVEDLTTLKTLLNWPDVQLTRENQNGQPGYQKYVQEILADQKILHKLIDLNREDLELYEEALQLRANRRQEMDAFHRIYVIWQRSQLQLQQAKQQLTQLKSQLPVTYYVNQQGEPNDDLFLQETNHLCDAAFLDEVYRMYFKRQPDQAGKDYFLQRLQEGEPRYNILLDMRHCDEFQQVQFHPCEYPSRLNLGCGLNHKPDYLNVDFRDIYTPDLIADIRALTMLPSDYYEEMLANHCLQHVAQHEVLPTLKEWFRVLQPGGQLQLQVPNVLDALKQLTSMPSVDEQVSCIQRLFGTQSHIGDWHFTGFTQDVLHHYLEQVGFVDIQFQHADPALLDVIAVKPDAY